MASPLVELFDECFPRADELPRDCSIRAAREANQPDFIELISAVSASGQRPGLIKRLRNEHPIRSPHKPQWDARLFDALDEGACLAWAVNKPGLEHPEFCFRQGMPDIYVPGRAWIEVKTVHRSAEEEELLARAASLTGIIVRGPPSLVEPHDGLIRKFEYGWQNALMKFERASSEPLNLVWFSAKGFDFPTSGRRAWEDIAGWMRSTTRPPNTHIVICSGHTPKLTTLPGR